MRETWTRSGFLCVLVTGGCGFEVSTTPSDSMPPIDMVVDMPIDMPMTTTPAACKDLPSNMTSGMYTIDPDGIGPDAPLSVYCDMDTEGGGWTLVFFPASSNLTAPPMTYTSSTPTLLSTATRVLLAYRASNRVAANNFATLNIPNEWKTATPFSIGARDVPTMVRINGAAEVASMLRYGFQTFTASCTDNWGAGGFYGRVCVTNTVAPFFNGWNANDNDSCSNSNSAYNAAACSTELRFSIAIK